MNKHIRNKALIVIGLLSLLFSMLYLLLHTPIAKSIQQTPTSPEQGILPLYRGVIDAALLAINSPENLDWTRSRLIAYIRERATTRGVNPTIMLELAQCESGLTQFNKNGSVLRGEVNPHDIGIFQISEVYWLRESKKLGYNIYDTEDNVEMAMFIATRQGYSAWNASRGCWGHL